MDKHITEANLAAYLNTEEKFLFCMDLLGLSLTRHGDKFCTDLVEKMEQAFENLFVSLALPN